MKDFGKSRHGGSVNSTVATPKDVILIAVVAVALLVSNTGTTRTLEAFFYTILSTYLKCATTRHLRIQIKEVVEKSECDSCSFTPSKHKARGFSQQRVELRASEDLYFSKEPTLRAVQ